MISWLVLLVQMGLVDQLVLPVQLGLVGRLVLVRLWLIGYCWCNHGWLVLLVQPWLVGWLVVPKQLCLVGDVGATIYDWLIVANGAAIVSC